jgi:hypothetical protein
VEGRLHHRAGCKSQKPAQVSRLTIEATIQL